MLSHAFCSPQVECWRLDSWVPRSGRRLDSYYGMERFIGLLFADWAYIRRSSRQCGCLAANESIEGLVARQTTVRCY